MFLITFSHSSKSLVIGSKNFPALRSHESWRRRYSIFGHLSHPGSRDEVEVVFVASGSEEFHGFSFLVVSCNLEGDDLNSLDHVFDVNEEFLTVPDVVEVEVFVLGVLHASGVTASDEVGDTAVGARRCVPHDLGGSCVIHRRGPDGEDGVLSSEGAFVEEGLMLVHAGVSWYIIVLGPSTERVEEKNGVLVSFLEELFSGIL